MGRDKYVTNSTNKDGRDHFNPVILPVWKSCSPRTGITKVRWENFLFQPHREHFPVHCVQDVLWSCPACAPSWVLQIVEFNTTRESSWLVLGECAVISLNYCDVYCEHCVCCIPVWIQLVEEAVLKYTFHLQFELIYSSAALDWV